MTRINILDGGGDALAEMTDEYLGPLASSFSFSADTGGVITNKHVICIVNYSGNDNRVTGITIDGQSATVLMHQVRNISSLADHCVIIAGAKVTSVSASLPIVISANGNITPAVTIYRVRNLQSLAPVDTAGVNSPESGPSSGTTINIDVAAGGVIFAAATQANENGATFTAGLTQDYSRGITGPPNYRNDGGHYHAASAEVNHAITLSADGLAIYYALAAVSLR